MKYTVDDITNSIRVCIAFACGVLMMIVIGNSYFE